MPLCSVEVAAGSTIRCDGIRSCNGRGPSQTCGSTWLMRAMMWLMELQIPSFRSRLNFGHGGRWKARLRSASLLDVLLRNHWDENVRVFRWKWQAEAAARRHRRAASGSLITDAVVEEYTPGTNVLLFRPPPSSETGGPKRTRGSARLDSISATSIPGCIFDTTFGYKS